MDSPFARVSLANRLLTLREGSSRRVSAPSDEHRLGSGLPCLESDLGFPEFESFHLKDFSIKAQLSKSVASTIPPRPLRAWNTISHNLEALNVEKYQVTVLLRIV